jgi:hypothetical protein
MAYKSFWKTCRIALALLAPFFIVTPAGALQVYLQDTDGNPLPSDARWRVSGFEEGIWYESGASNTMENTHPTILYFYGKNVIWPDVLVTNMLNPHTSTVTLQFPIYSNSISVIMNGPPTDSLVTWQFTTHPAALTNSTSYQAAYTNSFAVYDVATNTLTAIPHGTYKISPSAVQGYATPAAVITNITGDPLTNEVSFTYTAYSNVITVTVYGFPTGNCEYTITGPADFTNATGYKTVYTNNVTIASVPTGSYVFNFPGVLGYSTPTNTLEITGDPITNDVEATYVLAYPTNIPSGEGIQKFYQKAYFFTNVYLHDSGVPLHSRFAAHNTNTAWGEITGTLSDQTDLQAALDGKASAASVATVSGMVVIANGNIATNAGNIVTNAASILTLSGRVDNAEGAITTNAQNIGAVSNLVVGVSNDVEIIKTNYAQLPDFGGLSGRVDIIETNYVALPDYYAHISNETADIQHLTAAEKAIATNAVQQGANGTSTNLSDYNNDAGFVTNSSPGGGITTNDVKNVAPLMTNSVEIGIGKSASAPAGSYGVAIGENANASTYGSALGRTANGSVSGAGFGYSVKASSYGAAIGYAADATSYGSVIGAQAKGINYGVAIGRSSVGSNYAAAVGAYSRAISNSVAVGANVTNPVPGTTRVRGDLYLDGGTKIYTRAAFNSGEFTELATGGATAGTYPVFAIPLGGAWTDFEIKASTNNFADLCYYYKSWTNTQDATRGDTNALCYFTDDHAADVRAWILKTQTNAISEMLTSTNSEVETVYFYPSHDCVIPWSEWMSSTNAALVWSYVRVDDLGFEMNASGTKQHWSPIRPDSWDAARTEP